MHWRPKSGDSSKKFLTTVKPFLKKKTVAAIRMKLKRELLSFRDPHLQVASNLIGAQFFSGPGFDETLQLRDFFRSELISGKLKMLQHQDTTVGRWRLKS